ncbi:MAG: hypothetical protein J7L08_03800, partial [Candidatus Aenigmarchaeota archaeon]|nr:hypothetical protein [Candidatus Aenigmarchaeota archaeon]
GTPNFLIVVGSGGSAAGIASDIAGSLNIAARLGGETVTTEGGDTTTVVSGESATLASGTNNIYLGNAINAQVSTITNDNMPTTLANGIFTDDDGSEYKYEQTITVGSRTFTFSNSDNDLDNPALIIDLGSDTSSPVYTLKVNFEKEVDFDATESKGQKIKLFGKEYTVGTGSNTNELQLLGGSEEIYLDTESENTKTVTVGDQEYTVTLKGVTSTGDAVVQVEKDGTTDTKTISSGATKTVNGVDVYVDTANYYGLESKLGDATIMLGADEIWLQDDQPVMIGSSKEDLDGTLVDFDNGPGSGSMTSLQIKVTAADSNVDHLLPGSSFVDPVFGTTKLLFTSVKNGPTITTNKGTDENTDRKAIEIMRASNDAAKVKMEIQGNEATVEFANGNDLADDNGHTIHVVEGEDMQVNEYFILNSGDYQHFMKINKISCDDDDNADDDVTIEDVFSGTTYKITNKDLDGSTPYDWVIKGQTYKLYCTGSDTIKMVSSDYATDGTGYISVYPYLKPIAGRDFKVAFTDQVTVPNVDIGTQFVLPTTTFTLDSNTSLSSETGTVDYAYTVTDVDADTANVTFAIDVDQDGTNDNAETNPGILFVEDKDHSDNDVYNAVIIPTAYSTYCDVDYEKIKFTNDNAVDEGVTFDNNDYSGYIDPFGTYIQVDTSDSNQDWATLTYPTEQMYANLYIAGSSATVSGSTTGEVTRTGVIKTPISAVDTQVTETQKANENLILVGGPCVNKLTADALGLTYPACGMATVESLGIPSDGYMIKLVKNAFAEGKYALVVFGVEAKDTTAACAKVQADMADMTGTEYIYPAPLETTPEEE